MKVSTKIRLKRVPLIYSEYFESYDYIDSFILKNLLLTYFNKTQILHIPNYDALTVLEPKNC